MITPGVGFFPKVLVYEKQFSSLPGSRTKIDVVCGNNDFTSDAGSIPITMTFTTEQE
jgi:hypothetical protein